MFQLFHWSFVEELGDKPNTIVASRTVDAPLAGVKQVTAVVKRDFARGGRDCIPSLRHFPFSFLSALSG
jgi:hypothetical protein